MMWTSVGSDIKLTARVGILILWLCGPGGCSQGPASPDSATMAGIDALSFDRYEIAIEPSQELTIVPGFFRAGKTADLALVTSDPNAPRRVRVLACNGGDWETVHNLELRSEILFVDVVHIGGQDRLITIDHATIQTLDLESGREHALADISARYRVPHGNTLLQLDITQDLNQDGRDDLIVPDQDGFWIATQRVDGSFTSPLKRGPVEPFLNQKALDHPHDYSRMGISPRTLPWYRSRAHRMDTNRDGRDDLVFWSGNRFLVYHQSAQGTFASKPEILNLNVRFDADGAYTFAFGFADEDMTRLLLGLRRKTQWTALYAFRDLNGDNVADMITQTTTGRSLLRMRHRYNIHFGSFTTEGISFPAEPDTTIRARGKAGGLQTSGYATQHLGDFNGDGQLDMLLQDVNINLSGMVRAMAGHSVGINLDFYGLDRDTYPDRPTRHKIRRFSLFDKPGRVFFPAVLTGDMNGDGCKDVLVGQNPTTLHVFLGRPDGPPLFTQSPLEIVTSLPDDERRTRLLTLNRDDRQDILIHHTSDQGHRVTLLISQGTVLRPGV